MDDALRDVDTGLLNGDYFRATLPIRVAAARRALRPISVGLLALEADDVPPLVAQAMHDTVRDSDTACRLDGGRFGLLLEDTPEDGAVWTLQRLRQLLVANGVEATFWAGVASYPGHALEAAELLARAETALADARGWGDGRIEVAPPA